MTTTEEPEAPSRPDESGEGASSARQTWWARSRGPLKPIVAALAALGIASTATGYTVKDDIVPWLGQFMPNAKGSTSYTIASPVASNAGTPRLVPWCTLVEVKVDGELPEGEELWAGSILGQRKALAVQLEPQAGSPGTYASNVKFGRVDDEDHNRQLVVLTLSSEQAEWLRGAMDVSPYDMGSRAWPEGATPVSSVLVRRDSTRTDDC